MVAFPFYSRLRAVVASALLLCTLNASAQAFQFPTANRSLLEGGGGERFFVGTIGRSWESGCFGCVRSSGGQMHEGLDIRCLQRDRQGESIDPVTSTADGTVVYINARPARSSYGNYIVVRHQIDGLEIYSLYAHLREIRAGLKAGQAVKAGETIGIMGRTANTAEGISKERAHLHFEVNVFVSDRFPSYFKKVYPTERDDHGIWNGQNLLGLDPREILLAAHQQGAKFNLLTLVRGQTELCRVFVRDTDLPFLKRYPALIRANPATAKEPVVGYEVSLNYNGVPFQWIPRTATEMPGRAMYQLLSVNESEFQKNLCRRLVAKRGARWELAPRGVSLLDLLTH
jgi:murein DD-endopeptidase MepM/ murein hydrolase activator NlpD